jgi:epoxyqueuosine reductase
VPENKFIKQKARELGFDQVGIAKAEFLETEAAELENWLKKGYHGKMTYMENYFDKRLDPRLLLPGAKSIILLSHNYFPKEKQPDDTYQIAKYAYGEDYHFVLKRKMYELVAWMQDQFGSFAYRVFTDSAPVMERVWGKRAGLGWIGKNSLLIQPGKGSFFFLAEIITDLELEYDPPALYDRCGRCTRCIDACPTQAILPGRQIDATKCISYLTIELRDEIPSEFKGKWDDWIFGCDICQDVCPWNSFSLAHHEPAFDPSPGLLKMNRTDWETLNKQTFKRLFKKSAVQRTGYKGLIRNIRFLKE